MVGMQADDSHKPMDNFFKLCSQIALKPLHAIEIDKVDLPTSIDLNVFIQAF